MRACNNNEIFRTVTIFYMIYIFSLNLFFKIINVYFYSFTNWKIFNGCTKSPLKVKISLNYLKPLNEALKFKKLVVKVDKLT